LFIHSHGPSVIKNCDPFEWGSEEEYPTMPPYSAPKSTSKLSSRNLPDGSMAAIELDPEPSTISPHCIHPLGTIRCIGVSK
jgi:hypothetical protein